MPCYPPFGMCAADSSCCVCKIYLSNKFAPVQAQFKCNAGGKYVEIYTTWQKAKE